MANMVKKIEENYKETRSACLVEGSKPLGSCTSQINSPLATEFEFSMSLGHGLYCIACDFNEPYALSTNDCIISCPCHG